MSGKERRPCPHCDFDVCFYCRMPLAKQHDHDHFPLPWRAGGDTVVPCCLNCHSLKDRIPIGDWPLGEAFIAMEEMGPLGRLLFAKCLALMHDLDMQKRGVTNERGPTRKPPRRKQEA